MKLTKEEKQKITEDTTKKLAAILAVNGLSLINLDAKMLATLIMVYQQGLKDAEELLK